MTTIIRPYASGDLDWSVSVNNAAMPAVSELGDTKLTKLAGQSPYFRIAEQNGSNLGLLLCFGPDADYDSMNYVWVCETFDEFLYVDRVVVGENARGSGAGGALYDDMISFARAASIPRIVCEVNERPPNPGSMRFHDRFGFKVVGRQDTDGGKKSVAYMSLEL